MMHTKIKQICEQYNIQNYTINSDGSIDVNGNVNLSCLHLNKIPLKFRNISGIFSIVYNNLTDLEGCPLIVNGCFSCACNKLTSLKGCPIYVGEDFYASYNQLESLDYITINIKGNYYLYGNPLSDEAIYETKSYLKKINRNKLINDLIKE